MKKKQAVSLVILAITIIIMIILAGVIILSLDNSGIMGLTEGAVEDTNIQKLEQDIKDQLVIVKWYKGKKVKDSEFEEYLTKVPDVTSVTKVAEGTWEVKRDTTVVTVYQNGEIVQGKMDIWNGATSAVPKIKEFNWYIYTTEELKFLADFVNNGNALTATQKTQVAEAGYDEADYVIESTTIVYLMNDLDLGARYSGSTLTSGTAWTPIGNGGKTFTGIFEGNNHYITGVYINQSGNFGGLFGRANEIRNLTIKDGYIEIAGGCIGGIVGFGSTVTNCHNVNTTLKQTSSHTVAGIVGQINVKVEDCTNSGTVIGIDVQAGGITGRAKEATQIINCTNIGDVRGEGKFVGGIVGLASEGAQVENCTNKGAIRSKTGYVAGIVGYVDVTIQINNCVNEGRVRSDADHAGGIVSLMEGGQIANCVNKGKITGTKQRIGGIVGENAGTITTSINTGDVVGEYQVVGGIAGINYDTIKYCYNLGNVQSQKAGVGGICGMMFGKAVNASISNTYNKGTVTIAGNDTGCIGGIIGYVSDDNALAVTISNNYNIGRINVTGSNVADVGGIIGYGIASNITVSNSYYLEGLSSNIDNTKGEAKSLTDMKTAAFVTELNTRLSTHAWEIRTGENDGYPVLIGLK